MSYIYDDINKPASYKDAVDNSSIIGPVFPSLLEFLLSKMDSRKNYNLDLAIIDFTAGKILAAEGVMLLAKVKDCWEVKSAQGKKISLVKGKGFAADSGFNRQVEAGLCYLSDFQDSDKNKANDLLLELRQLGVGSMLSAPVGKFGILVIISSLKKAFSKFDETNLKSIAAQAGYLLKDEVKEEKLEKASVESRKMLSVCEKIITSASLSELYNVTLRELHSLVKSDTASLMIIDALSGKLRIKAVYGLSKSAGEYAVNVGDGIAGWVAGHKKALITQDAPTEINVKKTLRPDTVTSLTVPIMAADSIIGVVNLGSRNKDFSFSKEDIALVSRVMRYFALALKNRGLNDEGIYNTELPNALVDMIESNNPYAKGHSKRVAGYTAALAKKKGLTVIDVAELKLAAVIHDIGYASIPSGIFAQKEPLTSVERMLIKNHPVIAGDILIGYPKLSKLADNIRYHHENFDGSGYTAGLKGNNIPLGSRIIALTDAFDAMTSRRAYREAFTRKEALIKLKNQAGKQFDPELVTLFCRLLKEEPELGSEKIKP